MGIKDSIYKLRTDLKLSQSEFASIFNVSRQSVQKWEAGTTVPELDKLIEISKRFDISLDTLIMNRDTRVLEEMAISSKIVPNYSTLPDWEFYPSNLSTEYIQSLEEGLDIEMYEELFKAVDRLPKNDVKKKLGDVLFDIVCKAKIKESYKYKEPSELHAIFELCKGGYTPKKPQKSTLYDKTYGAVLGRIAGCMLGKTVECIHTNELVPFLKESGNYPMHRYILRSDISDETVKKYTFNFQSRVYADEIDGMPTDDDTNYIVLGQKIIEDCGRDFTPKNVAAAWLKYQPKDSYCTAERVAFCNFIKGYEPPYSAVYKNPFREWIGAQIRGDYFGYINPGDPHTAAEMAWRDASISHVKNGIYGEMLVSAMIATAATEDDIETVINAALSEIPYTSRLHEEVNTILQEYKNGMPCDTCFKGIHEKYDEYSGHGWCHTISNALVVVASLLYGKKDFGSSICLAVQTGFDTDCNGATVGSVLGMMIGAKGIPEYWTKPFNDLLYTTIFGVEKIKISDIAKKAIEHINI